MSQETDADRGWDVYRRALPGADTRLFQAMMWFCMRHAPAKAPEVMQAAAASGIQDRPLLIAFLGACRAASPPMMAEALAAYASSGPGCDDRLLYDLADICRRAGRPCAALSLVSDAIDKNVRFGPGLLSMFAACCAAAGSESPDAAAAAAEQLLNVVRSNLAPPPDKPPFFVNVAKALLAHRRFDSAASVLTLMEAHNVPPGIQIYTLILAGLARANRSRQAMAVFHAMVRRGVPVDAPVFTLLVNACGRCRDLDALRSLHAHAYQRPALLDDIGACSLMFAYDRCWALDAAERMFLERCAVSAPTTAMLHVMIVAYRRHGRLGVAVDTFERMKASGVPIPDRTRQNMLCVYSKAGLVDEALDLFRSATTNVDTSAFVMLVQACARDRPALADLHRHAMERSLMRQDDVLVAFVSAYQHAGDLPAIQNLQAYASGTLFWQHDAVRSAFILAYAYCSSIDLAERVFDDRRASCLTSMVAAYAQHGLLPEAMGAFRQFTGAGLRPNSNVIGHLLQACARAGALHEAADLVSAHGAHWAPGHAVHVVDLYGRIGDLDHAERLAADDLLSLMTVLAACRSHKDVARAERVLGRIRSTALSPANVLAAAYRIMSDVYASVGRAGDVAQLHDEMRARNLTVVPGRTTVIVDDRAVHFRSGDDAHDPNLRDAHRRLMKDLEAHGYATDPCTVVSSESPLDARRSVRGHSEKLALAFALSAPLPAGAPIRLAKTTRVCPDCHDAAKRVSQIYDRDVYLRDERRHHRFRDGQCSCGDVW